jgi:hypothetical protein
MGNVPMALAIGLPWRNLPFAPPVSMMVKHITATLDQVLVHQASACLVSLISSLVIWPVVTYQPTSPPF